MVGYLGQHIKSNLKLLLWIMADIKRKTTALIISLRGDNLEILNMVVYWNSLKCYMVNYIYSKFTEHS